MHGCINSDVITKQAEALKLAISEHKWYLSEKAVPPHDVGWEAAEADFFDTYFLGFTCGWRICCCINCVYNKDCVIGIKYHIEK